MEPERKPPKWISYVGDCKALDTYLDSKSGYGWLVPKFMNAFLRGFAQVLFANNPISGLLLALSLFWIDVTVGIASVLGAAITIFTAALMKQDAGSIQAGLFTYNGLLVGCVTASLWTPIYGEPLSVKLWGFVVVGSILSVFITSGCAKLLSTLSLPCLTLPFNIVNILLFVCLMPPPMPVSQGPNSVTVHESAPFADVHTTLADAVTVQPPSHSGLSLIIDDDDLEILNSTKGNLNLEEHAMKTGRNGSGNGGDQGHEINWGKVCIGVILSMGQIFAVENVFGSILMYVAVAIYSPLLFLMSVLGAIIGTFAGLLFTVAPDYEVVYSGICGYNTILAASASGFFYTLTFHSFLAALGNVAFTVILQQGFAVAFRHLRIPFFTLPFILSTFLFLSITSSGDQLQRVTNISFPEMHRYEYAQRLRHKQPDRNSPSTSPESKELV